MSFIVPVSLKVIVCDFHDHQGNPFSTQIRVLEDGIAKEHHPEICDASQRAEILATLERLGEIYAQLAKEQAKPFGFSVEYQQFGPRCLKS